MSEGPATGSTSALNDTLEKALATFQKNLEDILRQIPSIIPPSLTGGTSKEGREKSQALLKQAVTSVMEKTLMEMELEQDMESNGPGESSKTGGPGESSSVYLSPASSSGSGTSPTPSLLSPSLNSATPVASSSSSTQDSQSQADIICQTAINTALNMGPRAKVQPRPPFPDVNYGKLGVFAFREPSKPILFNPSFLPIPDPNSQSGRYHLQRTPEYIRVDRGYYIEFLPPDFAPGPKYRPDYRPLYPGAILIPPRSRTSTEMYEFPTVKPAEPSFPLDPGHRKDKHKAFRKYALRVKREKHYLIAYSKQIYEPAKPFLYHPLYLSYAGTYYTDKPPVVVRDMGRYVQLFHPGEEDIPDPEKFVPDYEAPFEHLHLIPSPPGQYTHYSWPTEPLAMYCPPPEDADLLAQAEMEEEEEEEEDNDSNPTKSDALRRPETDFVDPSSSSRQHGLPRQTRVKWHEKVGVRVFNDPEFPLAYSTSSGILGVKRAREEDTSTTDDSRSNSWSDSAEDGDSQPPRQKRKLNEYDTVSREGSASQLKDSDNRKPESHKNKPKKQDGARKAVIAQGTKSARDYEKFKLQNKLQKRAHRAPDSAHQEERQENELENHDDGFFCGLKNIFSNVMPSLGSTSSGSEMTSPHPSSSPSSPSYFSASSLSAKSAAPAAGDLSPAMALISNPRPLKRQDTTIYDFSTLTEAGNSERHHQRQHWQQTSESHSANRSNPSNFPASSTSPGSSTLSTARTPRPLQRNDITIYDFMDRDEVVEYERVRQEQRLRALSVEPYRNDLQVVGPSSLGSPFELASTSPASSVPAGETISSPGSSTAPE